MTHQKTCRNHDLFTGLRRAGTRGGVLVGAIVTMMIMAALGAGMVSQLGTISLHKVRANFAERAMYLAESGVRFAVSEYHRGAQANPANPSAGEDALMLLDNASRNVPGGGSFTLSVSEIDTAGQGHATGFTIRNDYAPPHDIVEVGENLTVLLPGVDGEEQTIPEYYGVMDVGGTEIRYRRFRVESVDPYTGDIQGTLFDVYAPVDLAAGNETDATLLTSDDRFLIESTGTYGAGLLGVSRTTTGEWFDYLGYKGFAPRGSSDPLTGVWDDPFPGGQKPDYAITPVSGADLGLTQDKSRVFTSNWFVHPQGGFFRRTFLLVNGFDSLGGNNIHQVRYHYVPFKHNSANLGLQQAWDFNNQKLSYDIQIKTATSPAFNYGAMGFMFRATRQGQGQDIWYQGYGISLMRYNWPVNVNSARDFIPSNVKPVDSGNNRLNNRLLLVLWEQTAQNTWQWIAYKSLHMLNPHTRWCTPPGTWMSIQFGQTAANPLYDTFVRGGQYCGDGFFIHDDSTIMIRVVERTVSGQRTNDIQLFFGDARWSSNTQAGRLQNTDAFDVQAGRFGYEQRFSPVRGEELWRWPSVPDISSANWNPAENDWFTAAVPWDHVNPSRTPAPATLMADEAGRNSIIRDGKFTSINFTNNQITHPEFVIHTFGHTSTTQTTLMEGRVYFSDLAVRLLKGEGGELQVERPWAGPILY